MTTYKRLRVIADPVHTEIESFSAPQLQTGEVLVVVAYSGINYKDALATKEKTGVVRSYPITPGVDASGIVADSKNDQFKIGDEVLVTGYDFGVAHDGGFTELAVVPGQWLVALPKNLSLKEAMIFGTAGFTAALAVDALQRHGLTTDSRVLITGATGGVAGFAIHFLHQLGVKNIIALSRKADQDGYLARLGVSSLLNPQDLPEKTKPLNKQQFDFIVDTVGGAQITRLLPLVSYGGSVALCGNAGGIKFETTVLPFILRGINLLGIDSVQATMETRLRLWEKMADWSVPSAFSVQEITLDDVQPAITSLLDGKHVGRTIIALGGK